MTPAARNRLVGNRIVRVEAMIETLVKQAGNQPHLQSDENKKNQENNNILTPVSCGSPISHNATPFSGSGAVVANGVPSPENGGGFGCLEERRLKNGLPENEPRLSSQIRGSQRHGTVALASSEVHTSVSETLLAALPSQEDVETIASISGNLAMYSYRSLVKPYRQLEDGGLDEGEQLKERPNPNTHPIIIARKMLLLAIALQCANPEALQNAKRLSEPAGTMARRLVDTATTQFTKNDDVMATAEGMECLVLEGIYQSNDGNLRQAWLAWRRAIGIAQLIGLQRHNSPPLNSIESTYKVDPRFFWYRLLYVDRFMSLMLGLPQASLDNSMVSGAAMSNDTPMGQFERRQCVIAGRILERNERGPSADDLTLTQAIDMDLQKAAASLPSKWWLTPNLATIRDDHDFFWEMHRLHNQMFHFNLLNLLHLPYMLHSSFGPDQRRYEYSRITCANAARELLNRYIMFRSHNRVACCCRVVDFFALMASLTLLLTHLDSHRKAKHAVNVNVLAHQRQSDRAMIEQALENMLEVAKLNADLINEKSANVLRKLLSIEADAAQGLGYKLHNGTGETGGNTSILRLQVPHIGLVTIASDGEITKEAQDEHQHLASDSQAPLAKQINTRGYGSLDPAPLDAQRTGILSLGPSVQEATLSSVEAPTQRRKQVEHLNHGAQRGSHFQQINIAEEDELMMAVSESFNRPLPLESGYSGVPINTDQWAFQGVDVAFFDSLMRETNTPTEGEAAGWWMLAGTSDM
jgi:hypothetical protein